MKIPKINTVKYLKNSNCHIFNNSNCKISYKANIDKVEDSIKKSGIEIFLNRLIHKKDVPQFQQASGKLVKDTIYSINENDVIYIGANSYTLSNLLSNKKDGIYIIGRNTNTINCDISINDPSVSRKHLKVSKNKNRYLIEDLGSKNGTIVKPVNLNQDSILKYKTPSQKSAAKASSIITNYDELCRVAGNDGNPINPTYIHNNELARQEFLNGISSGKSVSNIEGYISTLNQAHKYAYGGINGKELYYTQDEKILIMEAGVQRKDRYVNSRYITAMNVEEIAKYYGDSYRVPRKENEYSTVYLEGISIKNLPYCIIESNKYRHYYPRSVDEYNVMLYKTHIDVLKTIDNFLEHKCKKDDVILAIATHYQYGANARPYEQINNSLFMNEVNTYLEIAKLPKMTQGNLLDHAAQRMQPENFVRYFKDYYNNHFVGS